MRPRGSMAAASVITRPAPPTARLPRCTRCQSLAKPSSLEYKQQFNLPTQPIQAHHCQCGDGVRQGTQDPDHLAGTSAGGDRTSGDPSNRFGRGPSLMALRRALARQLAAPERLWAATARAGIQAIALAESQVLWLFVGGGGIGIKIGNSTAPTEGTFSSRSSR